MGIWMRLGVVADVTKEEAEILMGNSTPAEKTAVLWELFGGGFLDRLDGETYIPAAEVEEFNKEHETSYEVEDKNILV